MTNFFFAALAAVLVYPVGDAIADSQKLNFSKDIPNYLWGWLVELYNRPYVAVYDKNMDPSNPPFSVAHFDLDLDKMQKTNSREIFVKWDASMYCGSGGCNMFLYRFDGNEWVDIGKFFPAGDAEIDEQIFNGMPVIWVSNVRYRWNSSRYERQ